MIAEADKAKEEPKAEPPEVELKPGFSQEEKELFQLALITKLLMITGGKIELKIKTAKQLPHGVHVESYTTDDGKSVGLMIVAPKAKRKRGKIFVPKKKKLIV